MLTRTLFVLFLLATLSLPFGGCSSSSDKPVEEQVTEAIRNDNYSKALELLNESDEVAQKELLLERTHLNYGLYLEYRGEGSMRENMTGALRQFIKTLEVNPNNAKARQEINQIMGIYSTMPNRQPPQGILDTLRTYDLAN